MEKTIEINGEKYVREADVPALNDYDTDHIIVVAQRGWIFEGYRDKNVVDKIRLLNTNNVRKWENGRGLGGLAKAEYKSEYKLDPFGIVEFAPEGVICTILCEW